ncbi:BatA domain-containing protein [Spirosoma areae]
MPFIEPMLLWGALAVIIPVAIHFWHQKRGKPLPWAATQWLTEKQQQQSRGLRFDNLLLLIVRCLLLLLLAILLAQPLLNWFMQPPPIQKVHLVQPSESVADNFRFELTEALKKGERVIWADEPLREVDGKLFQVPGSRFNIKPGTWNSLLLQTAINQIDAKNTELHLYISTNPVLAEVPAITVPARFRLHTMMASTSQPRAYLVVKDNRKLFINRAGKLTSSLLLDPTLKFQANPVHSGPVRTLLDYRNPQERQTIQAALTALAEVYGLDLRIDVSPKPNLAYDWILTSNLPVNPSRQTLYVISGNVQRSTASNVIFTGERLTPQTSERVETGQLPEWLGEQLLNYYGLAGEGRPLSQQDLKTLFVASVKPSTQQQAGLQNALLLAFVVLLLLERWLALTKNA